MWFGCARYPVECCILDSSGWACGIELELAIGCFFSLFFYSFLFVLVGRIDLYLCVLIERRCHSIVGGLGYFKVEAERFDFKKQKKKCIWLGT